MELIHWLALGLAVVGVLLHLFVSHFCADIRPLRFLSWGILTAIVMILFSLAALQAP